MADLMQPAPDGYFEAIRVSDLVNKVANTGPEVQKPATDAEPTATGPTPARRTAKSKADDTASDQMKLF